MSRGYGLIMDLSEEFDPVTRMKIKRMGWSCSSNEREKET